MNRSAALVPARGKSSTQLTLQPATGPCSRNLYGQMEKISAKFFDEMSAQNKRLTTFLSLL
jgi:hypothetical protein